MDDYYSIIARAVSRLPSKTNEARHAIYERARTALQETLRHYDPPPSQTEIANAQAALDAAIGKVEVDFLVGEMTRGRREEAAFSPPNLATAPPSSNFISRVKEFVRWIADKLS